MSGTNNKKKRITLISFSEKRLRIYAFKFAAVYCTKGVEYLKVLEALEVELGKVINSEVRQFEILFARVVR